MIIHFNREKMEFYITDPEKINQLSSSYFGYLRGNTLYLEIEEVLYLLDIRNAICIDEAQNTYKFNDLAPYFASNKKLLARYFALKDWRDKSLICRPIKELKTEYDYLPYKEYKAQSFLPPNFSFEGFFFKDDLITIVDDEKAGFELFKNYWFGQYGTYKAPQRGKITKLDIYETVFLLKYGNLRLRNSNLKEVLKEAKSRIKYFKEMYSVYEDWRKKGYILKTGFKFGTHFRIYMPNASPLRDGKEWVHSKHVIHIFPRKSKMLISEWARAIRVAHSVKKTFILAIPGKPLPLSTETFLDFVLYYRKNGIAENPRDHNPRFLMYALSEDEYIGGEELALVLNEAKHYGLDALLAIADRESSITYYIVKNIILPSSKFEYYEIEWFQP